MPKDWTGHLKLCCRNKQPNLELNGIPTFQGLYGLIVTCLKVRSPLIYCLGPAEAALLLTTSHHDQPVKISDREQMVEMLSWHLTRTMAKKANRETQHRYKYQCDKLATTPRYRIGDWLFVYFCLEETGKLHKLSQPWRGHFWVISRDDPDVTACY